jgi:hypothetical protein
MNLCDGTGLEPIPTEDGIAHWACPGCTRCTP